MSQASEVYLDTVGTTGRTWPRAYDSCIAHPCECGAKPMEQCINPMTRTPRKTPCVSRLVKGLQSGRWQHQPLSSRL